MPSVHVKPRSDIDSIAAKLAYLGALGKSMPPTWNAARHSIPIIGPDGYGQYVGRVLPGKGVYLDCDLKSVGITKKVPNVFEKTPVQKLLEVFKDERVAVAAASLVLGAYLAKYKALHLLPILGAITSYDGIISARAGGGASDAAICKSSFTTVASTWSSMFLAGGFPAAGTYTSGAGAAMDNTRAGAWSMGLANPVGSNNSYLITFGFTAAQAINMLMLVDLLVACGNITTNVQTTAQTINSTALTRYTSGVGVMMTFDITTALGATPANVTVAYTNSTPTGSRSTGAVALLASGIVQRLTPVALGPLINLQSGDIGVTSVQTVTVSALMGSGVIALNLYFPLAFVPGCAANSYIERDSTIQIDALTQIQAASNVLGCLTAYILANTTSTGIMTAFMRTVQG